VARNTRELAQRPEVDPAEEPSAEWGWHGGFPRGMIIAGWVVVMHSIRQRTSWRR
jgi:hypothetical protein